jgi:hypothetical protein
MVIKVGTDTAKCLFCAIFSNSNQSEDCNKSVDIQSYPISTLTPELKNAIEYMGNEERLAYDVLGF